MHVNRIVAYPEEGIAVLYDEHGRFVVNRDNPDILDIGPAESKQVECAPASEMEMA